MKKLTDYPFEIRPLSADEGGGYLISYLDFSECISDGETVEEAISNGHDALKATIAALDAKGLPVPAPNSGGVASGKPVVWVRVGRARQLCILFPLSGKTLTSQSVANYIVFIMLGSCNVQTVQAVKLCL